MSWSMNEIESLSRKAVRGAGYSWGIAEEAGKSVRWLASMTLAGPKCLAGLLSENDKADYAGICPDPARERWVASGGALCPLVTGSALSDRASQVATADGVQLGRVSYPMLLIPCVASVAVLTGQPMHIAWDGSEIFVAPGRYLHIADSHTLVAASAEAVDISLAAGLPEGSQPSVYRYELDEETRATLNGFAHRTYAPDTPESRLAGAGAGLSDND